MAIADLPTGVKLYYESHGEGEPFVFIPATGFSGEVWKSHQVPVLAKSMRVITFDPRGCGRSSRVTGVCTIDQMACDVAALLDHLGLPSAHVLGHSMGGRIALALVLNYPKKVKSLILAAGGSGPAARPGPDCVPGLPYFLTVELIEKGFNEFVRHEVCDTETYFTDDYRRQYPDKVKAFYDLLWPTHAKLQDYLQLCIARHNWEGTHRLGEIQAPTLVVVGDKDIIGSNHVPQSEVLAQRIAGAKLKVLTGQSHGFFWQVPEETNGWIADWVKSH
ncbi:MAG: alpha/beta hydrolase [Deltaproteobacteria bacterium]|nr:alpha/beta hydrolase [Deltaproteobacteria bacterium]